MAVGDTMLVFLLMPSSVILKKSNPFPKKITTVGGSKGDFLKWFINYSSKNPASWLTKSILDYTLLIRTLSDMSLH